MHLCMHDNRNSQKIIGVPSAAMARQTPLIVTKNILAVPVYTVYVVCQLMVPLL
jgi:hypothetical protein